MTLLGSSRLQPTAGRSARAFTALAALSLSFIACNTIFGIEPGELQPIGSGGAGGAGGVGGVGGSGGAGGSVEQCGTGGGGAYDGALRWASKSTQSVYALATGVAFGASNDVIVAGNYSEGDIQLGTSLLEHAGAPATNDIFLASFDEVSGDPRWARGFPAAEEQIVYDVEVHRGSGDIVLTGRVEGTVSFGDGTTLVSQGMGDVFIARFDKDGAHLWSRLYGDPDHQVGINVAVDGEGNIVLGALIYGTIDFKDDQWGTPGDIGLFVGKLDPGGNELWSRFYDTGFYDGETIGLDTDADDNIVLTGSGSGAHFNASDPFNGETDVYVIKYDKDGTYLWSRMFGGTGIPDTENGHQWGTAAAFDCTGEIFVTGAFRKDLAFGELPVITAVDPTDEGDIFVARLRGSDGEPVWARAFGDAGLQRGLSIDADALSNVVLGGVLVDTATSTGIDLGGGDKHLPPGPDGGDYREDLVIARYTSAGDHLWSRRFGDPFIQEGEVAVDPSGAIACAGDFYFGIQFDGTPGGELSDPERDMFVALFNP